jgi:hypothetical protein
MLCAVCVAAPGNCSIERYVILDGACSPFLSVEVALEKSGTHIYLLK